MIRPWRDPSFWLLLVANLWPMWLVGQGSVPPVVMYWNYWGQSVVILVLWTVRLLLSGYGKKGTGGALGVTVRVSTWRGGEKHEEDYSAAGIFFWTWFLAHLFYTPFLLAVVGFPTGAVTWWPVAAFVLAHTWSLVQYRGAIDPERVNILFARRIVPMHLSLLFGALFTGVGPALFLMSLKTLTDVFGHVFDHAKEEAL